VRGRTSPNRQKRIPHRAAVRSTFPATLQAEDFGPQEVHAIRVIGVIEDRFDLATVDFPPCRDAVVCDTTGHPEEPCETAMPISPRPPRLVRGSNLKKAPCLTIAMIHNIGAWAQADESSVMPSTCHREERRHLARFGGHEDVFLSLRSHVERDAAASPRIQPPHLACPDLARPHGPFRRFPIFMALVVIPNTQ
jgi:hypothetical protein